FATTATASTTDVESNTADNTATATFQVATPVVDLSISQANSAPPVAGSTTTFALSYSNYVGGSGANSDAHGVVLTDTLPAGLTYTAATLTTCYPCGSAVPISPDVTGNVLTFNLGTVAIGQSGTVNLTAQVSNTLVGGASITNTVQLS